MALAIAAGLLQGAPEVVDGERVASIALRFLLFVGETALQLAALSLTFEHCVRRRLSPASLVAASLFVAMAIGALSGAAFVFVFQDVLGVELDEKEALEVPLAAVFGAITGIFKAAIWGLAFVSPYVTEQAQLRRLETEHLRLEAEQLRVSAELAQLRSRLEPHFLLNTLNTIAGLVTQDPREARRLLACLGDLLRDALEGHEEMQTLHHEVTWLKRYAEILESRHGDAVSFDWDIPSDAGDVLLPRLLLQPLLENAVQHGALRRAGGGRVGVHAALRPAGEGAGARLVCTVTDNGPGLSPKEPRVGAVGLHAVRRRLELECPGSALRFQSSGEGTAAIVEVLIIPVVAA